MGAKPSCVDAGWDFCSCANTTPAMFVVATNSGPPSRLVVLDLNQNAPHSLVVDGVCLGEGVTCGAGVCGGAYTAHQFTNLPMSAKTVGVHTLSIIKFASNPAQCQGNPGWSANYTVK